MKEKPACGMCGDDLESPEQAIEHLSDQHSMSGPAVVAQVQKWEWPSSEKTEESD